MFATWWAYPVLFLVSFLLTVCTFAVWMISVFLGLGWAGLVASEIVFHVGLGYLLRLFFKRIYPRLLRPYIREQLLRIVEEDVAPNLPPDRE